VTPAARNSPQDWLRDGGVEDFSPQSQGTTPSETSCPPSRGSSHSGVGEFPAACIVGTLDVDQDEWAEYVASLDLLSSPDDAMVLPLLAEVLAGAPVPAPWMLCRGAHRELYFVNGSTHESSPRHPLHDALQTLARVCPSLATLPCSTRRSITATVREAWAKQAELELGNWYSAVADTGQTYYYHSETQAVMWENPRAMVFQAFDLKCHALDVLDDDLFLLHTSSCDRDDVRESAAQARRRTADDASDAQSETVATLLQDEDPWVRSAVHEALRELLETSKSQSSTSSSFFSAVSRCTPHSAP